MTIYQNDDFYDSNFDESLMENILRSAINDYLGYKPGRPLYETAKEWLFMDFDEDEDDKLEEAEEGFVSLFSVCEILNLNKDELRVLVKCQEDKRKKRLVESQFKEMFNSCRLE